MNLLNWVFILLLAGILVIIGCIFLYTFGYNYSFVSPIPYVLSTSIITSTSKPQTIDTPRLETPKPQTIDTPKLETSKPQTIDTPKLETSKPQTINTPRLETPKPPSKSKK